MTRRVMLAVVAALVATFGLPCATAAQPAPLDGFDAAVASAVRDWQVPGLAVAVVKDGTIHVQAGAGIVADSDPAYEQRECEAKAGAMLAAARDAVARAGEGGFGQ